MMSKYIVFDFYGVIYDPEQKAINNSVISFIASIRKQEYLTGIFTNTSLEYLQEINERTPFFQNFDTVISCKDTPKPDPKAFQILAEKLKCELRDIVMVDDHVENILAAQKFGIIGLVFTDLESLKIKLKEVLQNDN